MCVQTDRPRKETESKIDRQTNIVSNIDIDYAFSY